MKIGILETGYPPEELNSYPNYGEMLQNFITRTDSEHFEFEIYPVLAGALPTSAHDCDGWIISGSKHGVYDQLPWIAPLQALVREIHAARLPLLGICFGHQLIAQALGGKVTKSDKGWGVGLHDYQITPQAPDWMQTDSGGFTLNVMHQDQVLQPAEGSQVLAQSAFCKYAALMYGDSTITFQGHPEFSIEYEIKLIELRQQTTVPAELADTALQVLKQEGAHEDGGLLSEWSVDFFHSFNQRSSS